MIESHNLNENAVTLVLKELDLTQKSKIPTQKGEVETFDIFGLTEWSTDSKRTLFGDLIGTKS